MREPDPHSIENGQPPHPETLRRTDLRARFEAMFAASEAEGIPLIVDLRGKDAIAVRNAQNRITDLGIIALSQPDASPVLTGESADTITASLKTAETSLDHHESFRERWHRFFQEHRKAQVDRKP